MPFRNRHIHCQTAQNRRANQSLSKNVSEPRCDRKRKSTKNTTSAKKTCGLTLKNEHSNT